MSSNTPHQQAADYTIESPEQVSNSIISYLRETKREFNQLFRRSLQQRAGWLNRLKYSLFTERNSLFWPLVSFYFIWLLIVQFNLFKIKTPVDKNLVIFSVTFMMLILLSLIIITPKLKYNYDDFWWKVKNKYLEGTDSCKLSREQATVNLKRAIAHYKRESQPLYFMIELIWAGIFIGGLPDPEFQKALLTNLLGLSEINPFGFISIISLPFILFFYGRNYAFPMDYMEQVLSQIEYEDELPKPSNEQPTT